MHSALGLVRHAGNEALFQAIEMSALATLAGAPLHLHAEGLRGTGKTTILRAARRILPPIRRVRGCLYNCDPDAPHCPQHRDLDREQLDAVGDEWVPMPFLEISHSAKVGTAVGSIDLGRLVDPTNPAAALLPGTLPQAHRGIVFIDEINRLAETSPELADVLLDAMGTKPGRVQIEETGLPAVQLSLSVSVWAASNPDEDPGPLEDIRRQLSDRFDFTIPMGRPGEAAVVAEILQAMDGGGQCAPAAVAEQQARLCSLAGTMAAVRLSDALRIQIAGLYARFGLESLRAVQAVQMGLRLAACLAGRREASAGDLTRVVPLALHHRVDGDTMAKVLSHLRGSDGHSDQVATAVTARPAWAPQTPAGAIAPPSPHRGPAAPAARGWPQAAPSSSYGPPPVPPRSPSLLQRIWQGLTGTRPEQPPTGPQQHQPAGDTAGARQNGSGAMGLSSPPALARPIETLAPHELVRTEEELRG